MWWRQAQAQMNPYWENVVFSNGTWKFFNQYGQMVHQGSQFAEYADRVNPNNPFSTAKRQEIEQKIATYRDQSMRLSPRQRNQLMARMFGEYADPDNRPVLPASQTAGYGGGYTAPEAGAKPAQAPAGAPAQQYVPTQTQAAGTYKMVQDAQGNVRLQQADGQVYAYIPASEVQYQQAYIQRMTGQQAKPTAAPSAPPAAAAPQA